jgi:hypothetical protein
MNAPGVAAQYGPNSYEFRLTVFRKGRWPINAESQEESDCGSMANDIDARKALQSRLWLAQGSGYGLRE